MNDARPITGMGAALVDLFADVSDADVSAFGSPKASMSLIDPERSRMMRATLDIHARRPGGSAANTAAGVAALGLPAGFIGKTGGDDLGRTFRRAFVGVDFPEIRPDDPSAPTGHCIVLVTPDAERTMYTVLGAAATLSPADPDADLLSRTGLLFGEGYLWSAPGSKAAWLDAVERVRGAGGHVAMSLSDATCAASHRSDFRAVVDRRLDVLLANRAEACALFETDDTSVIADVLRTVSDRTGLRSAVTLGADGAMLVGPGEVVHVPARTIDDVTDLTGAGDQFAAGFLVGLRTGRSLAEAGDAGVQAAGEVIRHVGPRPPTPEDPCGTRENRMSRDD